ncbi:MAG: isopenicillin N synthase family oxygenase, partial [Muriicola sp.]|nr:isopenicillin N synthase family oxygenase [Muriicola sp.]
MSAIPSVDLRDYLSGDPEKKEKFVKEIGSAFENIGFVALSGHFLSETLIA